MLPRSMALPVLLALGCATTPPPAPPPEAAVAPMPLMGTWAGQISVPGNPIAITLRLGKDGAGTLDVPAQNAWGLPVQTLRSEADAFELQAEIPGAAAVLSGNVDGDVLRGDIAQAGHTFPFELSRARNEAAAAQPPAGVTEAERLLGSWHGALVIGAGELSFELNFEPARGTTLEGRFSVHSQGLRGLPIEAPTFDGVRLTFRVTLPGDQTGAFDGALAGSRIGGTYAQGGGRSPFWMEKGQRPATTAPRSEHFEEHEVTFGHGDIQLAGTLTLPRGVNRPPVGVLITGSGPQDRDQDVFGFKIFRALAHQLALRGVATLRFDDRGIGKSTGNFTTATTHDFADDAEAAVRFLQQRNDIDVRRIGLVGHSEGAVVAPIVGARNREVAFLVLLAAPAQPLGELLVEQVGLAAQDQGKPVEESKRHQAVVRKAMHLLAQDQDLSSIEEELVITCAPACKPGDATVAKVRAQLETPWFRSFARLDPAPYLRKVRAPVLALSGELDRQVPGPSNVPLLRQLLGKGQHRASAVEELPGMNHLLQQAKTGAVSEYATLPRELEPQVPQRIAEWLGKAAPASRRR
jgi:uncharacterized protein